MALIKCPECEREISDKATACPFCGYPIAQQEGAKAAHTPAVAEETDTTEVVAPPKKNKTGKIIALVCAVAVLIGGIMFGVQQNNKKKAEEEAAAIRAEYIDNLHMVHMTMLDGAAKAETMCNLTQAVWYNTIYEKFDSETDKYTRSAGRRFNDDFNVSLAALYADQEIIDQISEIKTNQGGVTVLMKKLQNPNEEFKICYETVTDMYNAYKQLTDLAISPSGSLNTYSEDFSEYDSECLKYYEQLRLQIPEK